MKKSFSILNTARVLLFVLAVSVLSSLVSACSTPAQRHDARVDARVENRVDRRHSNW